MTHLGMSIVSLNEWDTFKNIFSQNFGLKSRTLFRLVRNANELSRGGRGLESQEKFGQILKKLRKTVKDSAKALICAIA